MKDELNHSDGILAAQFLGVKFPTAEELMGVTPLFPGEMDYPSIEHFKAMDASQTPEDFANELFEKNNRDLL